MKKHYSGPQIVAITNWAQKLPIQVVQQLAGHSDISTTRKYYSLSEPKTWLQPLDC
jgi:integrase